MEHLVGYIIIALSVTLTSVFTLLHWFAWKRCWDVSEYGGVLVRFAHGSVATPVLGHELVRANEAIRDIIKLHWPDNPELLDYRVEVVPLGFVRTPTVPFGKLPDGTAVGGSIRTERFLPITKKHHVAVVVDQRTGAFIAHEVLAHIVYFRLKGNFNTHDPKTGVYYDPKVKEIEDEAKARMK